MNKIKKQKGFTLIEILVVIGIIAILAAVVLIAINPARQFAQARDSQRVSNLNTILNAVGQRMADNRGVFAGTFEIGGTTYICGILSATTTNIMKDMAATTTEVSGNLGCLIPTYLPDLPTDPTLTPGTDTGYDIFQDANGRIHVLAPATETSIPRNEPLGIIR